MLSQLTIPKDRSAEPALDQQSLYALGINHISKLAHRIWTDYNVHDPGITILELLSYALTDLSYRASLPIKDLLASEVDNAAEMKKQFFTARQILPSRPLTLLDYRKLLIDLKGVKNAWLRPATLTYYADIVQGKLLGEDTGLPSIKAVNLRGLYDVIIEYMDDVTSLAEKAGILSAVKARLHANRNLCEDFVAFNEVQSQNFLLCCELELSPDADAAEVQAEILFRVQQYLAPAVNNYTLTEMLERTKEDGTHFTVEEIFDGPPLDCGFIDDDELANADLRTEIRLSDVISVIMDIDGVCAVKDIVINPLGTAAPLPDKWIVPVEPDRKALLNQEKSRLVFYKRNMPVTADATKVKDYYKQLMDNVRAKAEGAFPYDLEIPLGHYRRPGDYYSFQNHFPAVYGLSEYGLNSASGEKRKALAYQLKAYLLFFDQLMANHAAQLSHIKDLFSTDPDLDHTYFCQIVNSFADSSAIYAANSLASLKELAEDKSSFLDRRDRFLRHLIARFAEQFTDLASIMCSAFSSNPETIIGLQCDFLRDYPAISRDRSLAYNYSLKNDSDLWNTQNVSGLEKRLAKLLGLRNFSRRNLGDIAYDVYAEIDSTPGDEFRWRIRNKDTGAIILSSSTKYATPQMARNEMQTAIALALLPSNYQRKVASTGKRYFNVVDGTGEVVARRIEYFDTEEEMNSAIAELVQYLQVNYSDEGMYLVEMILLRPEQNADPFLPICPDLNCTDCVDADPYSFRIQIVLPAYSSRFSNMDFRRYVEQVIREETPAHILPKICWISREDMAEFEKAYRDWIYLKSKAETAQRSEKLKRFVELLFRVKNIYPEQKLHECDSSESAPKFILGQSSLGTFDTDET